MICHFVFTEVHGTFKVPSEKIAFVKLRWKVSTHCIYYRWTIWFDGSFFCWILRKSRCVLLRKSKNLQSLKRSFLLNGCFNLPNLQPFYAYRDPSFKLPLRIWIWGFFLLSVLNTSIFYQTLVEKFIWWPLFHFHQLV